MSIAECLTENIKELSANESFMLSGTTHKDSSSRSHEKAQRARRKRDDLLKLRDIAGALLGPAPTEKHPDRMNPVYYCGKLVTDPQGVEVRYSHEREQGYLSHVRNCNKVHLCPVCARRELEHWKETILKISAVANHKGYSAFMLVLTAQHEINRERLEFHSPYEILYEQFSGTLSAVIEAYRFVYSDDHTKERDLLRRVKHQIKHLEVRFSANGYHPHLHALIYVDERDLPEEERGPYEDRLRDAIYSRYQRKLKSLGYEIAPQGYYCQAVRVWGAASRYIQKLEAELEAPALEMTLSETKRSEKSYSMFQLLALYEREQRSVFGFRIEDIFRAYASGIKGRRAFTVSENIAELLGITLEELREREEDERREEARKQAENDPVLALIDTGLWWYIVRNGLVIALYRVADTGSAEQVEAFLVSARQSMEVSHRDRAPPAFPPLPILEPDWMEWTD